ncbi:MAG: GntR family transcriptional regulator [Gammaproteobacteria bacterium]|nr:GntR family transcriptional regulator [Gammaproteobacteria bacterium]
MLNQQTRVTVQLREMILNGEFTPGERITETSLARSLDASRTPVRYALSVLEQEGLVTGIPNRGYRVERFSMQDISNAIDLRGTLEGMAARIVAEHGLAENVAGELQECLDAGDRILAREAIDETAIVDYTNMNARFHEILIKTANNRPLTNALNLNDKVPFAGASAMAVSVHNPGIINKILQQGHAQHHVIVEAIANGEGMRVEALMREHARITKKSLDLLDVENGGRMPGLALVSPRADRIHTGV